MNNEIKEDLINSLPFNFSKVNFVNLENIGEEIKKNKQTKYIGNIDKVQDKLTNELNGKISNHIYENIEKNGNCYYTETSKLLNKKLDISLLKDELENGKNEQNNYKQWGSNEMTLFRESFEYINRGTTKEGNIKLDSLLNGERDNNLFCKPASELLNSSSQHLNFFDKWDRKWNVYQSNEKDVLRNVDSLENENKQDMLSSNYDNNLDKENDKMEMKLFNSFKDGLCNNNEVNEKLHTYFKNLENKQIMSNKYEQLIKKSEEEKNKKNNTVVNDIKYDDYKQIPEDDVKEIIKNIKKRLGFFSNNENNKYKNIIEELSSSTYSQDIKIVKKKSQHKLKGDKKKKHKKKKKKTAISKIEEKIIQEKNKDTNNPKIDRQILMDSLNYSEDDQISEEEFLSFFNNSEKKNENSISNKSDIDKDSQNEEVPLSDHQTYINKNETDPLFLDISSAKFKQNFLQAIRKYESDDEISEAKELEKWEVDKEDKREILNTENDSDNDNNVNKTNSNNIITNYVDTNNCEEITALDKSFSSTDIVEKENIPKEIENIKEDNISSEIVSPEKNENSILCICEILEKYKMNYLIEKTNDNENNNPNDYLNYNNYLSQLNEFISVNNYEHKNNSNLNNENINVENFSEQIDCYMHTIFDNQIKHLNGLVTDIFS